MSGNSKDQTEHGRKKAGKLSRVEAIMKMGAVAGGIPFINGIMKENSIHVPG